jgi:hypothetical protein
LVLLTPAGIRGGCSSVDEQQQQQHSQHATKATSVAISRLPACHVAAGSYTNLPAVWQ